MTKSKKVTIIIKDRQLRQRLKSAGFNARLAMPSDEEQKKIDALFP